MKYIGLSLMLLLLAACHTKDADYYRVHPQALQAVIEACPQKAPSGLSCDELNQIAAEVNQLAFALQQNPQEFGKQILALQTELASLSEQAATPEMQQKIAEKKQRLAMHYAIVTWLESPEY